MEQTISNFYNLSSKLCNRTFQAHPLGLNWDKIESLSRGIYMDIQFPIIFKQAQGNRLEDMLDTGTVCLYLISERLRTLLQNGGLSGWQTFDIKLLTKDDREIAGYYGFAITAAATGLTLTKGKLLKNSFCPTGRCGIIEKGFISGLTNGTA